MALVREGEPVPISFAFRDNNRKTASSGLYLPSEIVTGGIDAFAGLFRDAVLPLTNAQLLGASATYVYAEDVVTLAPPESEVERKLVLVFGTAKRRQKVSIEIPSPVFALESPNTDEVDIANPLVAAFADVMINGAVGPLNGPVTISGEPITTIQRAYISHRYRKPR